MCESCGAWLDNNHCAFCATELVEGAAYCPECGNPTGGIVCPSCGSLSFFDYCPGCHRRLTEAAEETERELRKNPQLLAYLSAKQEFADLEAEAAALAGEGAGSARGAKGAGPQSGFDQSAAALIAKRAKDRRQSQASGGSAPAAGESEQGARHEAPEPSPQERPAGGAGHSDGPTEDMESRKRRLQEIQNRQAELKARLAEAPAIPPGYTTNQQVRRFEMSIKPPITQGWLCNAFNVIHQDPMHCTRPGDGGHWVIE